MNCWVNRTSSSTFSRARPLAITSFASGVLVTSRNSSAELWGTWCERHRVDMLSPADGAQVLLHAVLEKAEVVA